MAFFEIYRDEGGEYRWRMKTRNGRVVADSAEGYKTRLGATKGARNVWRLTNSSPPDYRQE